MKAAMEGFGNPIGDVTQLAPAQLVDMLEARDVRPSQLALASVVTCSANADWTIRSREDAAWRLGNIGQDMAVLERRIAHNPDRYAVIEAAMRLCALAGALIALSAQVIEGA